MRTARLAILSLLVIFLAFSAWLVSLFGNIWLSLGRDLLLAAFVLISLTDWRSAKKPALPDYLILAFIFFTFLSFFVRTDMFGQWLRGVRYLLEPFILLLTLRIFPLTDNYQTVLRVFVWTIVALLFGALVDFFVPAFPGFTFHQTLTGYLGQIHLAGSAIRLQSILAGPNAFGLFLIVALMLAPLWKTILPKKFAYPMIIVLVLSLILTYSRSSYIGLFAGLLFLLIVASRQITNGRFLLTLLLTIGLLAVATIILTKPADLIRTESNADRLTQYQRIYNERNQIGLLGRGAGTAGLVSEYAFDNSPNYHSENTYLDVYENIGPLGALAYLGIWIALIVQFIRRSELKAKVIGSMLFGLLIAGLFIDSYTGQIAIWIAMIFSGLS